MNEEEKSRDEMAEEESFAELLRESSIKAVRFNPGQKVKARVVSISSDWVFIDLGAKSEGYLDAKEFLDEEGRLSVAAGELIEAYFLSADDNQMRFTTRIAGGEAGRYYLEDAWQNGIPVEGLVEKEVKGGFEIRIAGGLRGFCPFSQMGLQRENPKDLTGRHLDFRITLYGENGRNIVLSNRAVLEEERRKQREEQKSLLLEGARVRGTISSIHNFGAFVKIGSVDGLIPVSEIGWDRTEDINEVLKVGQEVEVVAIKLDWENDRLSFSLKRALPDPWESLEKDFPPGSRHMGTVVRLTNFGAFVSLAPGVDGLLHISKLGAGKRIRHPHEAVSKGQAIEVKIDAIDRENKRISLSPAASEQAEDQSGEDFSRYTKGSPAMGTLADLMKAKLQEKKKK
ncbi:MAG: 30S ribosomal protein S1 [Deltaproteobacteria bacterium]|jgi:small subunit ribosomal protein S1|nr:30S ribosomal protein S1 [Deltaproteobacteria bacterium]MDA8305383.1 30S ribosomal protein S1 [Deltaproteobacteria bacterium]